MIKKKTLDMLAQGADYQEIANKVGTTVNSVRWYASKYGYTNKGKSRGKSSGENKKGSKPDVFKSVDMPKPKSKKETYESIISMQKKMIKEYAKVVRELESKLK